MRWGVIATGGIAEVVTGDMLRVPDVEVLAVSSRRIDRAREFAERHGIPRPYGDHHELLADPDVEVVYVATPHAQHHEVARDALLAGKHVLCEKAFTLTVADAEDLVALARDRGLFLMEAMWTRFNPLVRELGALVADGTIGDVRTVHADFGFVADYDARARLWNPAMGGGSLLDLGVYPVSFAHLLLGEPSVVHAHGSLAPSGVDAEIGLLLGYPGGAHALLSASLVTAPAVRATVVGTMGRVEVHDPFFRPEAITVHRTGEEPRTRTVALDGAGYTYQIQEVVDRVRAGDVESPRMPHADTVAVMRTMTRALDALGVTFPRP